MAVENIQEIRKIIAKAKLWDNIFAATGLLLMLVAVVVLLALVIDLAIDGVPRLSWQFVSSFPSRRPEDAGVISALVGSVAVMLVTGLAAIPLGIASGIYLEEYARKNWFADFIEINVTNLAGVPSIVYGLLALGFFVYQLKLGQSILTAGLTLALLILPVVIVTTREAIKAIPNSIREASYAVGATKWQTVSDHVLPYSAGSIMTGVIVGLSRAIGETAPLITIGALTFIAFLPDSPVQAEFPYISFKWLMSPFTVLPLQMFNWVSRPQPEFQNNAAAAGLIILLMTLVMNGFAIYLRYIFRKNIKW